MLIAAQEANAKPIKIKTNLDKPQICVIANVSSEKRKK
jgi:hypothetical protein